MSSTDWNAFTLTIASRSGSPVAPAATAARNVLADRFPAQSTAIEAAYQSFSDVAADVVEARILLGIHFRFADTVARRQGRQAADSAFSDLLPPVR